ncbi:MAG: HD domain-containing protein [Clostridia bacterium]|nr:HD domain-containing protein [Clostridia bacterium]
MNEELVQYIENEVFPKYDKNEEGHGIKHIKIVIKRSLELAKDYDVDLNMVYTIASYHDLGHYIDRKTHEIISAKMFMQDEKIRQWFTDEQIIIIKEAIEDHRASSNHEPRTIYGKIISTADRTIIDIDNTIKRTYSYGKRNYINLSEEQQIERVYRHLTEKYGENGYAKVYLEDKEFEDALDKLRQALLNKEEFIKRVKKVVKTI